MQVWVSTSDVSQVAFEVLDIDLIEADNGSVEAYICFCDAVAEVVWSAVLCEVLFGAVEGLEEGLDVLFVGFLGSGLGVSDCSNCRQA